MKVKLQSKQLSFQYVSTDDFLKDMDLLVHNAWDFNEPSSQIYRDATTLQSVVRHALGGISGLQNSNPKHYKSKFG